MILLPVNLASSVNKGQHKDADFSGGSGKLAGKGEFPADADLQLGGYVFLIQDEGIRRSIQTGWRKDRIL